MLLRIIRATRVIKANTAKRNVSINLAEQKEGNMDYIL